MQGDNAFNNIMPKKDLLMSMCDKQSWGKKLNEQEGVLATVVLLELSLTALKIQFFHNHEATDD